MGINNGGQLLYSLQNLDLANLVSIATSRAVAAGRTIPRIDIDANWVIRKYFITNGTVLVGSIVEVVSAFVQAGFAVSIIFDGDDRPAAKMAYFARRTEVEKARIDAIKAKGTVMAISQRLADGQYKNGDDKVRLTEELAKEEKFLTACERKANKTSPDCYDILREAVEGITGTSGNSGSVVMYAKATNEADYAIGCRAVSKETDLILGNDTDYPGIVGNGCLAVRSFKYSAREKTIVGIELSSGCKNTITETATVIGFNLSDANQFKLATFPLLDGASPVLRAVVMIGLGCDTLHKTGIKGVGPKTISDWLASMDGDAPTDAAVAAPDQPELSNDAAATIAPSRPRRNVQSTYQRDPSSATTGTVANTPINADHAVPAASIAPGTNSTTGDWKADRLLDLYVSKDGLKRGRDALWTCAQAVLYQPGNIVGIHPRYPKLYLHGPPPGTLCKYLDKYNAVSNPYNAAEDVPASATCHGNGISGSHLFLKGDGCFSCSSCNQLLCRQCVVDTNERENKAREKENQLPANHCCTDCYSTSVLAESGDADTLSITAMKRKLDEMNQRGIDGLSNAEIMELYDLVVAKRSTDFYSADIASKVKFPLCPATSLDDGSITSLLGFDFQDGARMIRSVELTAAQRVQLADLFANLLSFDYDPAPELQKMAKVLPKMILEFAEGSRADSGHRLMQRCIRHAMDSKTVAITKARGEIIEHNGEIGLRIRHQMQPSFKEGEYAADVMFTKSAIVACSCTCKAGADCKKCDKHVDVHILPILLLLVVPSSQESSSLSEQKYFNKSYM